MTMEKQKSARLPLTFIALLVGGLLAFSLANAAKARRVANNPEFRRALEEFRELHARNDPLAGQKGRELGQLYRRLMNEA
jgi:hypothetical protein